MLTLDRMLAKHANQVMLSVELEKDFRENPVRFFKTIIMPLLPHEARLAFEQVGVVGWKSLLGDGGQNQGGVRGENALPVRNAISMQGGGLGEKDTLGV